MIGLGGWGGRNEKSGPYLYFDDGGKLIRDPRPGRGGSHGPQSAFKVTLRDEEHPITKGMPKVWMHAKDELYDSLRGPAEEVDDSGHGLQREKQEARAYDHDDFLREGQSLSHSDGPCRLFHEMRWISRYPPKRYRVGGYGSSELGFVGRFPSMIHPV